MNQIFPPQRISIWMFNLDRTGGCGFDLFIPISR